MASNNRIKGMILAIIGALLWGISGTVAQFLFQDNGFSPEWLVVIRLLVSGFLLITFGLIKKDPGLKQIFHNKKDLRKLILFSIFGMLGSQYTYFNSIHYGNAATATILQYLSPVIVTCYLAFCAKKMPNLKQCSAIVLAMIGTFFIITKGDIHSLSISKPALFWGILSAFAAAIYTIQPITLLDRYSSTTIVGCGMLVGGFGFSAVNPPWHFTGTWSLSTGLGVAFVILFGTLAAYYCFLESLKYIAPTETSILGSVEPLSAAILSVFWLHVSFGIMDFIGTTCIIATIVVLAFSKEQPEKEGALAEIV